MEFASNENEAENAKGKGEYHTVSSFLDELSTDDEPETEIDDKLSVKSEGNPQPTKKKKSITRKSNSEDDIVAMKSLLIKELQKSLNTETLLKQKDASTNLIINKLIQAQNDMEELKISFVKSDDTCTIESTINKNCKSEDLKETNTTTERMSSNSWLESKKEMLNAKKQLDTQNVVINDEAQSKPEKGEPEKNPESKNNDTSVSSINKHNNNVNDGQVHMRELSKALDKRASSKRNTNYEELDHRKAAAVDASKNAANYLMQNWGFKNRNSLKRDEKRIKDDLQKLQYGKF